MHERGRIRPDDDIAFCDHELDCDEPAERSHNAGALHKAGRCHADLPEAHEGRRGSPVDRARPRAVMACRQAESASHTFEILPT
jgi:hypothetical protein